MASPFFDQIHVLVEPADKPIPSFASVDPRTKQTELTTRPLMGDFIQYACDHLINHRVIFSNADILFDSSLEYFTKVADDVFDEHFYAISRWRLDSKGEDLEGRHVGDPVGMTPHPYPGYGSYDTFVFKPRTICLDKAKLKDMVGSLNYTLGVLGSENRLLYEVKRQYPDIKMANVYREVRTVHLHKDTGRSRDWYNRVNENGKSHYIEDTGP
ncbi:hypothetical protein K7432_013815 [Basidiobolus ranarum]|uniref:Uncharacterized protein n=1 Tax=Basidiobolus ranarum TaxID=34480 RepID=A0ABR2WIM3_9FUNG